MNKVKEIAMICMAVIAFTACNSDDNEGTKLPEVFTGKRLVEVANTYGSYSVFGEKLSYSNGKLTGYTDYELFIKEDDMESQTYKVTYSGKTMTVTNLSRTGGEKEVSVYTLNDDGYAVSMTYTDVEEYNGKFETATSHCTFEYSNGYLVKIIDDDEGATTINYENGDVVSYAQMGNTKLCKASTILNKGGVLPYNGWLGDATEGELVVAYYAGILGQPTKHLLSEEGGDSYTYELDEEEYVKTCTVSGRNQGSVVTYTFK